MRRRNLSALVLQDVAHRALQNSRPTAARDIESRRVLAELAAHPTGLDANHAHLFIVEK